MGKNRIVLERYQKDDGLEQKKEKRRSVLLTIVLLILLVTVFIISGIGCYMLGVSNSTAVYASKADGANKLSTILNIMENDWYFASEIDDLDERLVDQALVGMTTNSEDIHTEYMDADEIKSFFESIDANFVGIGVKVRSNDGYLLVETVYKNSPADESGMKKGDIIKSVDGMDIYGYEIDDVVNMIKGEANTKVNVGIIRGMDELSLDIIRQQVNTTVEGEMLDNGIAYIGISSFGELTCDQLITYLDEFKGASKLLLDLRDNGGGHLNSVVDIGSLFIAKDEIIVQQQNADGSFVNYVSNGKRIYSFDDIVILVNANTASAAEVLTLALDEQLDNVEIVGVNTYGKGTIQTTVYLADGSALKYTTGKWNSPSGKNINGTGIEPDVVVELPDIISDPFMMIKDDSTYSYDQVSDYVAQMQSALAYLGYNVERFDGYFDIQTKNALVQFENDYGLVADGILSQDVNKALFMAVSQQYAKPESDLQKIEAINLLVN